MANDTGGEMLAYGVTFALVCLLGGYATCSAMDPGRVTEAAQNAGLHDVEVGGYAPFACSDSDDAGRYVTGTRQDGQRVEAVVCCGLLKRCTVRW